MVKRPFLLRCTLSSKVAREFQFRAQSVERMLPLEKATRSSWMRLATRSASRLSNEQ